MNGQTVQVAQYFDDTKRVVAQKTRNKDKDFRFLGNTKHALPLYGQHLWKEGGRKIVVTEGELDCLSYAEAVDCKWAVVSIKDGAQSAAKSFGQAVEFLESFDEVIIMFDNDEPGRKASIAAAEVLSPGKAYIASLPLKDASDMLVAGRVQELTKAVFDAKLYKPDEVIEGVDLLDTIMEEWNGWTALYPWQGLNDKTRGMRKQEVITFCAGSGVGKSTICRTLAHCLIKQEKQTFGYVALEESVRKTALGLISVELGIPLCELETNVKQHEEKVKAAFKETVGNGSTYLYDHFGSTAGDNLLNKIRYMIKGCKCDWILLDHLSIVVSGMGDGDERRTIDNLMTKLRSMCQETGVGMIIVSHLKRPGQGPSHEEGGVTSLGQLRGSTAIGQLSDVVIGLERNQQDPEQAHVTTIRVLKNRFTGDTGVACKVAYNKDTGLLSEVTGFEDAPFEDEQDNPF